MPEFDSSLEYRDVVGHPGYKVGNDGSVWTSWKRIGWREHVADSLNWHRLRPAPYRSGHLHVSLKGKTFSIHRIVAEAFIGPCPKGMECRHFPDRNPANNNRSNLQWGTRAENHADKKLHGTQLNGSKHPWAILTEGNVREIRRLYATGQWKMANLAEKFGVKHVAIYKAVHRQTWVHVS